MSRFQVAPNIHLSNLIQSGDDKNFKQPVDLLRMRHPLTRLSDVSAYGAKLLAELSKDSSLLSQELSPSSVSEVESIKIDEPTFRWKLNADAMATEKLAEGIRNFDKDQGLLLNMVSERL